ncbi:hypothetical protein XENOCAPTIV_021154, partial [Xenoophorus captivus]
LQDVNEAEVNFNVAISHSQNFAFVHVAHAQFEHSRGNIKKAIQILQNAVEVDAKPLEPLVAALQSMQSATTGICSEDKENLPSLSNKNVQDSVKKGSEFHKVSRVSDGTGDLQLSSIFSVGAEPMSGSSDDQFPGWRPGSHHKRAVGLAGRVPVLPFSIPEDDDDDVSGKVSKSSNVSISRSLSRQTSELNWSSVLGMSSSKKSVEGRGAVRDQPPALSPDKIQLEDQANSTTTLLQTHDVRESSKMEDVTFTFEQVVNFSSPESCLTYLMNLEKRGNPQTDVCLLNKLKDCYSKVFARLPIRQYSKNTSYARILVRYAELKGIEDPDEASDHFIVARSNCKGFAFVHIAHAQFEVSQGNLVKGTSILHKALALHAEPVELLMTAMRNLTAGEKQLIPPTEEDPPAAVAGSGPNVGGNQEVQHLAGMPVNHSVGQPKPANELPKSEWKIPKLDARHVSPENKRTTPPDPRPVPRLVKSFPTPSIQCPSRLNPQTVCQTPKDCRNPQPNSFITPVVKRGPEVASSTVAPHRAEAVQQPCTPLSHTPGFRTPQVQHVYGLLQIFILCTGFVIFVCTINWSTFHSKHKSNCNLCRRYFLILPSYN